MELTEILSGGGGGEGLAFLGQGIKALVRRAERTPFSFLWAKASHSYLPNCKSHCLMTDQSDPWWGTWLKWGWGTSTGSGAMSLSSESWPSLGFCVTLTHLLWHQPITGDPSSSHWCQSGPFLHLWGAFPSFTKWDGTSWGYWED